MSIQSEITRISGNVSSALSAIADKGVSVPSGANSDDLATLIGQVETGVDTSDATAAAGDILSGKTAYVDGEKITGTIATKTSSNLTASGATVSVPAGYYASAASKSVSTATQATPSISVSSAGLITASATQTAGYVAAGTKSATKQLTTQAAKTVTPSTSEQTAVASGVYTTGAVKVKGDANLVAENIASGVSIFGVAGTHTCEATIIKGSFLPSDVTNLKLGSIPITGLGGKPKGVFITQTSSIYQVSSTYARHLAALAKIDDVVYSISAQFTGSKLQFISETSTTPAYYNLTLDDDGFTISNGTNGDNIYLVNNTYSYFAIM